MLFEVITYIHTHSYIHIFHKSKIHGHETGHNKNTKQKHTKIGRQNYNTITMLNNNDIYKFVVYLCSKNSETV
jgi:hypothetical protein